MTAQLDFERFLEATCNILDEDGFESYLPTIFDGQEILVVEGIPESVPDTEALSDVGPEHNLGTQGTFFAVRSAKQAVVAGEVTSAGWRFVEILSTGSGLTVTPVGRPSWFRL